MAAPENSRETEPRFPEDGSNGDRTALPVCPVCAGDLIEIRAKLQCARCHTILETCCEGGLQ